MPNQKKRRAPKAPRGAQAHVSVSAATDDLLMAALARGDESLETGRYIVTYRDQAHDEGVRSLKGRGLRIADARDFKDQAVSIEDVGDADALTFPEIGVAVVGSAAAASRGFTAQAEVEG